MPEGKWKNLFQIWRENGERLPFCVFRNSWDPKKPHYLRVERIEIGQWPYGKAWGTFHYNGRAGELGEKISAAGTYAWRLIPQ